MQEKIWEQRQGESDEAHARFLVYRNLGPARTIERAVASVHIVYETKRNKTKLPVSQWEKDSATNGWRERAAKWDVYMLSQTVPETAAFIFEGIKEFARLTLQSIQSGEYTPKNWAEVRDSLVVLASFVSPEIITSAVDNSRINRDEEGDKG